MHTTIQRTLAATAAIALAATAVGATAAAGTEPGADALDVDELDGTGLTIGVSNLGLSFPFPAAISDGIEDAGDEVGASIVTLDAQADVAKQANDVQDLINQGVDGILFIGVDAVASESMIDDIVDAGIPVMAVHQMVGDSETRDLDDVYPGLAAFVTQDEQAAGAQAGEVAVLAVPDGGAVAIVEGAPGFAEVFNRAVLFEQTLEDADADYEVVARQPGEWTPEGAEAACQNLLQANPDLVLLYAQSDDMAVGCANAAASAGSDAALVGIGGSQLGIDAIADGAIDGTVCYKPYDMGELALWTMIAHLTGVVEYDGAYITYDTPAITADNLDDCEPQW